MTDMYAPFGSFEVLMIVGLSSTSGFCLFPILQRTIALSRGGSPLNRLSWLRNSPAFLTLALESPHANWILFDDGQPLVTTVPLPSSPSSQNPKPKTKTTLTRLPTSTIRPLLGPAPYFAQGQTPGSALPQELVTTSHNGAGKFLESARIHGPTIVFLGTLEPSERGWLTLAAEEFSRTPEKAEEILGEPYFALDVTDLEKGLVRETLGLGKDGEKEGEKVEFGDPRAAGLALEREEAAIFSEGRTMIDWNSRTKFCPSCGSHIHSLWGGWKLSCSSLLPWASNEGRKPCPTAKGLHNVMHPRTDAVVITAVLDESGERILLGRNKRFPPGFYSTLAGFLEPSESFEDAVAREIWEESGVHVRDVSLGYVPLAAHHAAHPIPSRIADHSSLHSKPFPANLMIGCFAIADASQTIRTDLDNELEDARWFTRDEVLDILATGQGFNKKELRKMGREVGDQKLLAPSEDAKDQAQGKAASEDEGSDLETETAAKEKKMGPSLRVPPQTAIAGVLIYKFAHKELDGLGYSFSPKARI